MSDIGLVLTIFIAMAGTALLTVFYIRKQTKALKQTDESKTDQTGFNLIKQDLKEIRDEIKETREKNIETLENQLKQTRAYTASQLQQSGKIVQDVTERLTKLDQTNKQVVGFAQQLQSLENILKNPKQRGILGEYYLEELLKNVFSPSQYQTQYNCTPVILLQP